MVLCNMFSCFVTKFDIYIYILIDCIYISPNDENRAQLLDNSYKLYLVIKMCTGIFTTDDIWMSKKVCSVSSELSQSSIRRVSSKKDSSTLSILESQEYVSKNNQNALSNDVPYVHFRLSALAVLAIRRTSYLKAEMRLQLL